MAETQNRPLSPHLQIWRWQLSMALSIAHRATGIVLSAGAVLLVIWLVAAAAGPDSYEVAQRCAGSWAGYLFLFGFSLCLFYHLLNGIRHLFWDAGYGFELPTVTRTGWAVVLGTVAATIVAWVLGLAVLGGM